MKMIRMQCLLVLLALVGTCGLHAQEDTGPLEIGRGAPRETLAYFVMQPKVFTDFFEGFVIPKIKEEADAYAKRWESTPEDERGWMEKPGSAGTPEWGAKLVEYFVGIPKASSRVDIALIDILMGAPKMYVDMTLNAGATIDRHPALLEEMVSMDDITISGIAVTRYLMKDERARRDVPPLFAFEHNGHFYITVYDSIVTSLINGLLNTPQDGDTLSENSYFKEWYTNRTPHTLEMWINAREFRGWIERTEGLLKEDGSNLFREIDDNYINLRLWSQMIINIDLDAEQELMGVDFTIQTRREHDLLKKLSLPVEAHSLSRYMPADAVLAQSGHLGDLNDLWGRLNKDVEKLVNQIEEFERKQREEDERRWKEEEKRYPDEGHGEPMPPGGDKEGMDDDGEMPEENPKKAGVDDFLKHVNEVLEPAGLEFENALGLFTGSYVVSVKAPRAGEPFHPSSTAPVVIVLGVREQAPVVDALDRFVATMLEREAYGFFQIEGIDIKVFSFEGALIHVTEDAFIVVLCQRDEEYAMETMFECIGGSGTESNIGQTLTKETSMSFVVDVQQIMQIGEAAEDAEQRKLLPWTQPRFSKNESERFNQLTIGCDLSITPTSLSFSFMCKGATPTNLAEYFVSAMTGGWNSPERQTFDANRNILGELNQKLQNNYMDQESGMLKLPESIDKILEDGKIRRAYFQTLSDKRFENAEAVQNAWFYSFDELSEELEAVFKANEDKGFSSFTMNTKAKFEDWEAYILFYETLPNTLNGHMVLYTNGQVGWLHADTFAEAKALMDAGKPIPQSEWDMDDEGMEEGSPDEGMGDKDGIEDDTMSAEQRKRVAQNIIDLYTKGALQAPSSFALHPEPKVGQSATFTTTNLSDNSKRSTTYSVIEVTLTYATVEMMAPEAYVLSYRLNIKPSKDRDHDALEAWIGHKDGIARPITIAKPRPLNANGDAKPDPYTKVSEPFEKLELGGKTFKGTKTSYFLANVAESSFDSWFSEEAWFHGIVKSLTPDRASMELAALSTKATSSLRYSVDGNNNK